MASSPTVEPFPRARTIPEVKFREFECVNDVQSKEEMKKKYPGYPILKKDAQEKRIVLSNRKIKVSISTLNPPSGSGEETLKYQWKFDWESTNRKFIRKKRVSRRTPDIPCQSKKEIHLPFIEEEVQGKWER